MGLGHCEQADLRDGLTHLDSHHAHHATLAAVASHQHGVRRLARHRVLHPLGVQCVEGRAGERRVQAEAAASACVRIALG
jgi:hypothetical protein